MRDRLSPRLIGLAISAVCLAGVIAFIAGQDAPRLPADAGGYGLLAAALGIYAGSTLLRGLRWHELLRTVSPDHRRGDAYGLTVVAYMGNAVLPARGGDVLRVVLMADRTSAGVKPLIGSLIPEKLLDAAGLLVILAALTIANTGGAPAGALPAVLGVTGVVAVFAGLAVYLRLRRAGRLDRLAQRIGPFTRASRVLVAPRGALLFVLTLVIWTADALTFVLVGAALDLGLNLADGLLVVTLVSLSAMIPAGPGFVGTWDAALLFALRALDVTGGAAVGVALLFRFVVFVPVTVAGLVLVLVRYGGLVSLRAGRERAPGAPVRQR